MREILIPPALAYVCRHPCLRFPALVAFLVWASLRAAGSGGRYIALMMPRPGLTEDALTALEGAAQFSVLTSPPRIMKAIAAGFLPRTIDDNNYAALSIEEEECKRQYRIFLERMLTYLLRLCRIDVIVSGNFAYFAERELHAAAEKVGVPFIILHKENLKSPGRGSYFEDLYRGRRGPFTGRRIIVYNSTEKDIQLAAGIISPDRITVAGMPRLDRAHAWRRRAAGTSLPTTPTILFFTFAAKTGLPVLRRKMSKDFTEMLEPQLESLNWADTARLTMQAIGRFAESHPHVRIIVKSKQDSGQVEAFRAAVGGRVSANIELIDGGDPLLSLQDAWAAIGMNSSAILEALAMGKTVLTPAYGEAAEPAMQIWLANFGPAVERLQSPECLASRLAEICSAAPSLVPADLQPPAITALEQWAGNADGRASERVRAIIEAEIGASAQPVEAADALTRTLPT